MVSKVQGIVLVFAAIVLASCSGALESGPRSAPENRGEEPTPQTGFRVSDWQGLIVSAFSVDPGLSLACADAIEEDSLRLFGPSATGTASFSDLRSFVRDKSVLIGTTFSSERHITPDELLIARCAEFSRSLVEAQLGQPTVAGDRQPSAYSPLGFEYVLAVAFLPVEGGELPEDATVLGDARRCMADQSSFEEESRTDANARDNQIFASFRSAQSVERFGELRLREVLLVEWWPDASAQQAVLQVRTNYTFLQCRCADPEDCPECLPARIENWSVGGPTTTNWDHVQRAARSMHACLEDRLVDRGLRVEE